MKNMKNTKNFLLVLTVVLFFSSCSSSGNNNYANVKNNYTGRTMVHRWVAGHKEGNLYIKPSEEFVYIVDDSAKNMDNINELLMPLKIDSEITNDPTILSNVLSYIARQVVNFSPSQNLFVIGPESKSNVINEFVSLLPNFYIEIDYRDMNDVEVFYGN